MPRIGPFVAALCLSLATLTTGACGEPPDREMQQAQGAIDAARAAGADRYAREEFTAAQDALQRSHDAVALRDYRLALNHAIDSRERAQNAAKLAAAGVAEARVDADRALAAATTQLAAAHQALKAAEGSRAQARAAAAAKRTIGDIDRRVQEARAAFDKADYAAAVTGASAAIADLRGVMKQLQPPAPAGGRRRR